MLFWAAIDKKPSTIVSGPEEERIIGTLLHRSMGHRLLKNAKISGHNNHYSRQKRKIWGSGLVFEPAYRIGLTISV